MKYIGKTLDFSLPGSSVVTLGKFDGLHRGHQKLIRRMQETAEGRNTVIFTFDVSPVSVVRHCAVGGILSNEERQDTLERWGLDYLVECPFTPEVMRMSPEYFAELVLVKHIHAERIIVGEDFRFGFQRMGTPKLLETLGKKYGFFVEILDKELEAGREISSTWVRQELEAGNMELAGKLLGYPYYVSGCVVHGRGLGRTIGVPTINQIPPTGKLLPPKGVYASVTEIDGQTYQGISNVGIKPTVGGETMGVETYLFDCSMNLYGKDATVQLLHYQRAEQKFASLEKLKEQLVKDEAVGRGFFTGIFRVF